MHDVHGREYQLCSNVGGHDALFYFHGNTIHLQVSRVQSVDRLIMAVAITISVLLVAVVMMMMVLL